ncbi:MAG: hypothetical protein HFI09_04145 [Bacilli bacterium]|nr:hypothetical protein [Bacilli bacterium]
MSKNLDSKLANSTLINKGEQWKTYETENSYIKVRKSGIYNYGPLLEEIKDNYSEIPQLCEIMGIDYQNNRLKAYEIKKRKGLPIQNVIWSKENSLNEFVRIANELKQILAMAKKKNIVFKDIMTYGSVLYDDESKQTSIIGLDRMQSANHSDEHLSMNIIGSNLLRYIIENPKYIECEEPQFRLTSNFNTLAFYEIFLSSVFNTSLTDPKLSQELMIIEIIKRLSPNEAQKMVEDVLKERLNLLGFDKKTNLYGRMMDLANPNQNNSIDIADFNELNQNYIVDQQQRKLVRK